MGDGRTVRVVSLVPSATETLGALGVDPVACTRFCERPDLPQVGGTKNPDLDAIRRLDPDVVVVDRQENRREDAEALEQLGVRVWSSDVCSVTDALGVVRGLADLAGVPAPPLTPTERWHDAGRVVVPIWRRPWMAIGAATYGAAVLAAIGFEVVTGADDPHYPELDLARAREQRPVAVLVPSEPYAFRTEHLDELCVALPDAEVLRVDGQDLFWWGIRTPGAIRRLGAQLAPLRG